MKARERVLKAFNHEEADRVPTFCQSMMPVFERKLEDMWGDDIEDDEVLFFGGKNFTMYKKIGFDSAWGGGGIHVRRPGEVIKNNPIPKIENKNEYLTLDGKIHKRATLNGYSHTWYVRPYLTSEEKADEWYETYFNIDWEYDPNSIKNTNDQIRLFGSDDFVPTCGLHSILEPIWEALGLGLLGKLLRKKRYKVKRYIELRTKQAVLHAKLAAETDYDVFNLCDDTAFKQNTVINPKIHRELVIPAYKKIVEELHKKDKLVFFHSDGFTEPYFPGLIEARFDGVESLEPMAGMDLRHLKEEYGDDLCLIGNIDVSQLLPYGSVHDVTDQVKKCIADASEGGGYILSPCTDLTNSCKLENVRAMLDAVEKYGRYDA